MKTNNLYITLFAALAITACSKDNELPQGSAKDPNADMPDAYTSIAINTIPMPQILRQLPNLR